MPITLQFDFKKDTKTCHRFESRDPVDKDNFITIYLKKSQVAAAGIDPAKGLTATIVEREADDEPT